MQILMSFLPAASFCVDRMEVVSRHKHASHSVVLIFLMQEEISIA